jgi:tetratricopeptide (TPR) repeat protein
MTPTRFSTRLLASLVIATLGWTSGASAAAGSRDAQLKKARRLFEAGKVGQARVLLEKVVAKNPQRAEAYYYLGLIHMRNILTLDEAGQMLRTASSTTSKEPADARAAFRSAVALGRLEIKQHEYDQAVQTVDRAIASASYRDPVDEAHNVLGLADYYRRNYSSAVYHFNEALKHNPTNREATFNLTIIRSRLAGFNAAKAYARVGKHQAAMQELKRVIADDPRFVEARHRLALELYQAGQLDTALREMERAESITSHYEKSGELQYGKGLILKKLGRLDEALRAFLATTVQMPELAAAHYGAGLIFFEREQWNDAALCISTAVRLDPRAEYRVKLGELAKAMQANQQTD